MEMVLQQSLQGPAGMMMGGGAGCRPGPRPAAATAPMMAAMAKLEPETETETEREMMMKDGDGGEEGGGGGTEAAELRRGPWTVEEDLTLINYIADHGEGRWNALARAAGLKRTGKSCRLRWLNYLRPDVKRGDFTADEQLLILDLHSRWGNRWSKIAAQLPGRTDNEIKNYWRTRVQKHAKQLNCDVNSARFKDAMRFLWMPRLAERAAAHSHRSPAPATAVSSPYNKQQLETMMVSGGGGGDCSPISSAVTNNTTSNSSPSCSSRTPSDESAAVAPGVVVGGDDWAAAAAMQQQGADHEYWSTASALQQLTAGGDHHQAAVLFHDMMPPLQDLTGWVQGFSEAGVSPPDGLWSLDDMIWRMQ